MDYQSTLAIRTVSIRELSGAKGCVVGLRGLEMAMEARNVCLFRNSLYDLSRLPKKITSTLMMHSLYPKPNSKQ
jgi:hypothetical protein